jgi:hypothetical protein
MAYKSVRNTLDDILKYLSKDYKEAMKPIAEKTKLMARLNDEFKLSDVDLVATRLKTIGRNPEYNTLGFDVLNELDKKNGTKLALENEAYRLKELLNQATTRGSKKMNFGTVAGTAIGSMSDDPITGMAVGSIAGGLLGIEADQKARQMTRDFVKSEMMKRRGPTQLNIPLTGKKISPFENQAVTGAFGASQFSLPKEDTAQAKEQYENFKKFQEKDMKGSMDHFIRMNMDKEYRQKMLAE